MVTLQEQEQIEEAKNLIQKTLNLLNDLAENTKDDSLSNEVSRAIARIVDANGTIENIK